MADFPHVPAAFINAIAEEGTKAEAVEWLQKTWNELCALRAAIEVIVEEAEIYGHRPDPDSTCPLCKALAVAKGLEWP